MKLLVNGEARELPDALTIAELVAEEAPGLENGRGVAVAVDAEVVPRSEWSASAPLNVNPPAPSAKPTGMPRGMPIKAHNSSATKTYVNSDLTQAPAPSGLAGEKLFARPAKITPNDNIVSRKYSTSTLVVDQ